MPYERLADGSAADGCSIIGAGSGSDVAIALAQAAPSTWTRSRSTRGSSRSAASGTRTGPTTTRAWSRTSTTGARSSSAPTRRYDLILFALPDSLALVTGAGAIRLESYLFTREAIEAARDHLHPAGWFAMYNYYREDWLIDRLRGHGRRGVRPRAVRRPARAARPAARR